MSPGDLRRNGGDGEPGQLVGTLPGDTLVLPGESSQSIAAIYRCAEELAGQVTEWLWLFLADRTLVEVAPRGAAVYREHRVIERGSAVFEELAAQDGLLVRFEKRVRAGEAASRSVHVTLDGQRYRVAFTGNVRAQLLGQPPPLSAWQALGSNVEQNVYFGLVETTPEPAWVLGLWTGDVCLSFGRPVPGERIIVRRPA